MDSDLLLPIITRYHGIIQKGLHKLMINPLRLLWIEGSLNPHMAEGHHGPSHIGPLIEVHQGREKVACLKDTHISNRFLGGWETMGQKATC